jgi:hypothetical protein
MTRGKLILILADKVLVSCEFNGDMYPDGHGKDVFDSLSQINNESDYRKLVEKFNKDNFQYDGSYFTIYEESLEWFEVAKNLQKNYFDNWFSDWLYIKNISNRKQTFITDNNGEITIDDGQTYAFNYNSDPDKDDKKYLGMNVDLENKEIEICCHNISYYYRDSDMEMTESDIEHIKQLICDDFNQGELCSISEETGLEIYGWWSIVKN